MSAVLQNWDLVEATKNTALSSEGSMDRQLEIYNESIQASLNKFKVAFQELSADVMSSDVIKGVVDIGTMIIKIIDEVVKHIGVLGTAITGLGIHKVISTAVAGANSVNTLGASFSSLISALATGGVKSAEFAGAIGSITATAGGAGNALLAMGDALAGMVFSPAGIVAGIALVVAWWYKAKKAKEEALKKQADQATDEWNENKKNIESYSEQYEELNKKLSNANLTESQRIEIKKQLLDLQNQISQKYDTQASGLDLVNGKLETQLDIVSDILEKEAEIDLKRNGEAYEQSVDALEETKKFKTKTEITNKVGDLWTSYSISKDMASEFYKAYTDAGFKINGLGEALFEGSRLEFDKAAQEAMDNLEALKEKASDNDKDVIDNAYKKLRESLKDNYEVIKDNIDNYNAFYEKSMYKTKIGDGTDDTYGDRLKEWTKLTRDYNDALLSDNMEKANTKRTEWLDYLHNSIEGIFDEHPQYESFFNGITEQVDYTAERLMDWKDIVDDETTYANNKFNESANTIRNTIDKIKKLELDGVDIQAILGNPQDAMYADLSELANIWDKNIDLGDPSQRESFADFLEKIGVLSTTASDEVDIASSSFSDFLKAASNSVEAVDKVNAALVNSFKGGGITAKINKDTGALEGDVAEVLNAYKDADVSDIFERTANGIILNREELRALESEQEKMLKQQFGERIAQAYASWQSAIATGDETAAQRWKEQYDNVRLLASAYDGATNAYKKWVDAQKMGEAGDQYDAVATTALKRGKELYDAGLVGTNEFRAIAQLYSNLDLSTASIDEITEAYENGVSTVKKYFTEGQEGAVAFADKLVELEYATKDADGNYDFLEGIDTQALANDLGISVELVEAAMQKLGDYGFNIHFQTDDVNLDDIRKELIAWSEGGNVDLTLRPVIDTDLLTAAGWDIEEDAKGLATVFTSTFSNEAGDVAINFTPIMVDENGNSTGVLSPSELQDYAMGVINGVHDDYLHLQIGAKFEGEDAIQQASDVAEQIHEDHDELVMNGTFKWDESEIHYAETSLDHFYGRLAYFDQLKEIKPEVEVDIHNDEQLRNLATDLLEMNEEDVKPVIDLQGVDDVDEVIDKLKEQYDLKVNVEADQSSVPTDISSTVHADVDVDSSGVKIADQTVHVEPEPNPLTVKMVAELDHTVVDDYEDSLKPIPRTQVFDIEHSKVDSYINSLHDIPRSVDYTVDVFDEWKVNDLPKTQDRYITYHIDTIGAKPLYKGTVSKSLFNGMSHVSGTAHASGIGLKQDENALINELGAEIVVRPSEDSWMIFNDGKPTFASLKKDDIIFNAEQTEELLRSGKTDSFARLFGGSYANGTIMGSAHARKVTGAGKFKKATTTSTKKSGGGGNGGGGGGNGSKSTKEAKEFSEILDEIEIKIDRVERSIKNLDTVASNTFNSMYTRQSALSNEISKTTEELEIQKRGYKRYMQEANKYAKGLSADIIRRIQNGEIDIQEFKDEDTWKKIDNYKKYYEQAIACRDAVYELQQAEADLWQQRFDVAQTNYENKIAQIQHMYDTIDSYIEMAENNGRITTNKYRQKQIIEENKKITELQKEYDGLKNKMKEALESGDLIVGSEAYYTMLNQLNSVQEEIVETNANISELNKSIRETNWDIFDKGVEKISQASDELEFLYELLGEELYDDKGNVTNNGIAGFGILASQYNLAMIEAQKYTKEINKLNKEIEADPYNQDLIDRRTELYESQRDMIKQANEYKESIRDLVKEGIDKQIDSLKELVKNYEDLMDTQKDEMDYAKRVADQQKNINKLQKQLNAYANDNSEEGATRRQRIQNELKTAQENLQQTQEERRISQTKKMLSDLQEEYEKILNARLDNLDALVEAVVDGVNRNSDIISGAIKTASDNVGYTMTHELETMFSGGKDLVSYFTGGKFVNDVTKAISVANNIGNKIDEAVDKTNTSQTGDNKNIVNNQNKTLNELNSYAKTGVKNRNYKNKVTGLDGRWVTDTKNKRVGWTFNDGTKATGWSKIDNEWYYFNNDGKIRSGLQDIGKYKYYLKRYGGRATDEWIQVGKKWYYFDKNGHAVTGWHNLEKDGKKGWRYFYKNSGVMAKGAWIKDPSKKGTYYVDGNGLMVANGKFKTKDGWRTFDKDGKWKGYKSGTRSVGANGLYWTNEGAPETIIRKSDGAVLTKLNSGDSVLNNKATTNMWDFANNPQKFLRKMGVNSGGNDVDLVINLNGLKNPSEFMEALRKDKKFERFLQEVTIGRVAGHGALSKNAMAF